MVRLCVVAPTVNVQVGGGGGGGGAGGDTLSCKAALPSGRLRALIAEQVLPKFSALFLQQADATAPDGSPIDAWLRVLAADMQASIETHLEAQFSGGAPGGGAGVAAAPVPGAAAAHVPHPRPSTSKPAARGGGGGGARVGGSDEEDAPRPVGRAARPSTSGGARAPRDMGL
jgi:hypothetical protein